MGFSRYAPPPHLACALLIACGFLLLGGASCERKQASERPVAGSAEVPLAKSPEAALPDGSAPAAPAPRAVAPPSVDEDGGAAPPSKVAALGPPPSVAPRAYVIAALGDSLTDKRSGGGGYLDVIARACPETVIDNFGKGGDMVNQMRRRFERDLLPRAAERRYTHLVLYGGVNDLYSNETAGRTNDRIERDLAAIYEQASAQGMQVIAVTVSPWGGFSRYFTPHRAETTRLLNRWIFERRAAGAIDHVVDSYPLLSCGDPEHLCPDYARPDGLHLNARGQTILGQALLEQAFSNCK